jgi:hypothetical protein
MAASSALIAAQWASRSSWFGTTMPLREASFTRIFQTSGAM